MAKKKRDIEGKRLYHFELSDKNRTVRWILIGVLLIIAVVAVVLGLTSVLQTPSGWQTVENSSTSLNCAHAFSFQYDMGAGEKSATVESKELSLYYGQIADKAWGLFYNEASETTEKGILSVNNHPNEAVEVDEALYKALQNVQKSGSRALYLGPVYSAYNLVINEEDAIIAEDRDPGQNEETAQYIAEVVAFTNDPEAVNLELLPGNKVKLTVSENYLKFAKQNDITLFLDFGWMKNAAAADYMADALVKAGYTNGYLISVDGFLRNLDSRGTVFGLEVFRSGTNGSQLTAVTSYTGPVSMVMLQEYRLDTDRYYRFQNGRVVTYMIDTADGMCKAATDSMTAYSKEKNCLELALKLQPLYMADTLSEDGVNALTNEGMYSIWVTDKEVRYNQKDLQIAAQDKSYTLTAVTK